MLDSKKCGRCKVVLPVSAFYKNKAKKDGITGYCKKCSGASAKKCNLKYREKYNSQRKVYRSKDREKWIRHSRDKWILLTYRITREQWNQMFVSQGGCCKICGIHSSKIKKTLAVDHNHETGNVRGLLCYHCNWLIGHAKESVKILESAIDYIKQ